MDHNPGAETRDHVSLEILRLSNEAATSLQGRFEKLSPPSTKCCIYRIPQKLLRVKENAYEPQLVSIGPLHHCKLHLVAMEEYKLWCLQNFLSRSKKTLEECVQVVSKMEKDVRDCYFQSIDMSSVDFVQMVLVDSCFIIEVLLGFSDSDLNRSNVWIYNRPWLSTDVRHDLALLENQLPFFAVESVYYLAFPGHEKDHLFLTLSLIFFCPFLHRPDIQRGDKMNELANMIVGEYQVEHFVDLIRICHLPSSPRSQTDGNSRLKTFIASATGLYEAGVSLEMGSEDKRLLDISYNNDGVLKIPKLTLEDASEPLFRNLIAFEMCHHQHDTYITDYICVIDSLINTSEDVDLLIKQKIIENWMGDCVAVAHLLNSLLINVTLRTDNFYFAGVFEGLNAYCRVPRHKWRAALKRDYFNSPWRGAATIAAIILLLLTFMQTLFSGMSIS